MYSNLDITINISKISELRQRLGYLLKECSLATDSKMVDSSSIFCAYKGLKSDGRNYISVAKELGAKCIIQEGAFNLTQNNNYFIENLRNIVGVLASYKYNEPSKFLKTIGVTGTNGKTSITGWLTQIYTILNKKSAVIGTLGAGILPKINDFASTTPDPITVQKLFDEFRGNNVDIVAIEVSSHALDQGRVNGIEFETAVFTNLTQEHLDYHHTMENYYQAKRKLFYWRGLKNLVINTDDKHGKRLYGELEYYSKHKSLESINPKILTYGIISGDVRATNIAINLTGTKFTLIYSGFQVKIKAKVIGVFNVYNILGVVSCLILDGYSLLDIARLINYITPIKGRMDAIFNQGLPLVIIDFAHTPDALEKTLQSLHKVKNKQKVYCVFGCGGDRDPLKRPIMGDIATQNANYTIITSDNPRTEAPNLIIEQIIAGINKNANPFECIENRADAINKAIKMAQSNDIVLIAGKGHEEYQDIMGVKYHFSDYEVAKLVMENIKCN